MDAKELRAKSAEDLEKELLELSREAFNLRMQKGTGQLSPSTPGGDLPGGRLFQRLFQGL